MVMADGANVDLADHGHAPDETLEYYYYRVSFMDDRCKQTGVVPGVHFGQPLGHADHFPGWDIVLTHWREVLDRSAVRHPVPRVWYLL